MEGEWLVGLGKESGTGGLQSRSELAWTWCLHVMGHDVDMDVDSYRRGGSDSTTTTMPLTLTRT